MCALNQPEERRAFPDFNHIQKRWNTWDTGPSIVKKMERKDAFTIFTMTRANMKTLVRKQNIMISLT